jgi:hypothetical protein
VGWLRRGGLCCVIGGIFWVILSCVNGWAWVRQGEGFGERTTVKGEGLVRELSNKDLGGLLTRRGWLR